MNNNTKHLSKGGVTTPCITIINIYRKSMHGLIKIMDNFRERGTALSKTCQIIMTQMISFNIGLVTRHHKRDNSLRINTFPL